MSGSLFLLGSCLQVDGALKLTRRVWQAGASQFQFQIMIPHGAPRILLLDSLGL